MKEVIASEFVLYFFIFYLHL